MYQIVAVCTWLTHYMKFTISVAGERWTQLTLNSTLLWHICSTLSWLLNMRNSITRWSRQNHGPAADQKRKRSENCSNRTSCRPIEVWFRFRRFNLQFYRVSIWKAQICYDTVWISHFSVSWYFVDRWRGKQRTHKEMAHTALLPC